MKVLWLICLLRAVAIATSEEWDDDMDVVEIVADYEDYSDEIETTMMTESSISTKASSAKCSKRPQGVRHQSQVSPKRGGKRRQHGKVTKRVKGTKRGKVIIRFKGAQKVQNVHRGQGGQRH